jgi:hypothetical protein
LIKFYLFKPWAFLFLALSCFIASAQSRVTGSLTLAEDGSALPGVSILEKATNSGIVTGTEGTYSINTSENAIFTLCFVGFGMQEVSVDMQSSVNITRTTYSGMARRVFNPEPPL